MATLLAACGGGGGGGGGGGPTNTPPNASFTATPSSGSAPLVVAFDASASTDPGGSIATYAWNFGDGGTSSSTSATTSRTFTTNGTYTVTLTVTDNQGATGSTTRAVTVASPNTAPTAAFQFLPTGGPAPLLTFFDGSGSSDAEGPIANYTWDFGDGTEIVGGKTPTHTFAAAGTYTVRLTVQDAQGASGSTTQPITVTASGGGSNPIVSGRVTYDRVPFSSTISRGLNYGNTNAQPAREVVVELISVASGLALVATTTDSDGNYAFTAPSGVNAFVRVKAQALRTTTPSFNIRVFNNTGAGTPLYVLDGSPFNTGTASQTKNLNAASGWGGTSYTSTRAAAPFAILGTLYAAAEFVHDNGGATQDLPDLDVYWSTRNNTNDGDVTAGDIGSTLFRPAFPGEPAAGIYVLGLENNDTDEYDQHVLAHEFQHYLEDAISRSDTPGGEHAIGDRLDLRLAFSEGFANAFSAMVLNDPQYRDSLGAQQGQSFGFNLESNSATPRGWFNEGSVQSIVWDLYDSANDAPDTVQIGYQPMYDALTGTMRTTPALTSIYPFLSYLRSRPGAPTAGITALASGQSINVTDAFATGETNDGSVPQALPIYTPISLNGQATLCGTTTAGTYNTIGNRLFLRFNLATGRLVTIRAQYTANGSTAPFLSMSDPDIVLYKNGFLEIADDTTNGDETLTRTLDAGEYVIEVYEWSHIDPTYSAAQRRGNTCFNVSVTG